MSKSHDHKADDEWDLTHFVAFDVIHHNPSKVSFAFQTRHRSQDIPLEEPLPLYVGEPPDSELLNRLRQQAVALYIDALRARGCKTRPIPTVPPLNPTLTDEAA
jgi:hypothetical protein